RIFDLGIPVFGICYGMQLMTHYLGGKVEAANHREYGKATLNVQTETALFADLPKQQIVWMSHGDLVADIPNDFIVDATSPSCPFAAISNEERRLYGVQFHPEVRHSEFGNDML
ncbi:gamma-glutamyl-gamma-aminobutyrate hydrolase family protein, partial [Mycobacterium tuberculosis]|nr:gamma-glutamyl-gamma-aminobutyrate hydrolase family protein [Mycobacterium tuberculosis]